MSAISRLINFRLARRLLSSTYELSKFCNLPFSLSATANKQVKYLTSREIVQQPLKRRVVRSLKLRSKLWKPKMQNPPYSHVCQVGDPVLRGRAAPVDPANIGTREFQKLLDTLVSIMRREGAVGLSAPQIGVGFQVIAMEYTKAHMSWYPHEIITQREIEEFPLKIFINPRMKVVDYDKVTFSEGCQSIKGFSAFVPRYHAVEITGFNRKGQVEQWQAKGFPARIVQHEMDHLKGQLYIDIMDSKTFIDDDWIQWNLE
ncbi:peptide deformylase, mitochondrial-like [Ptychodera flava]|uniref:peptide deformylase, mitochondrial-like n=1 Tax=Ptychodera flava TaxID=63121 RepID=UPI00396AB0BB